MRKIRIFEGISAILISIVVICNFIKAFALGLWASSASFISPEILSNVNTTSNISICMLFIVSGFALSYKYLLTQRNCFIVYDVFQKLLVLILSVLCINVLVFIFMKSGLFYNIEAARITNSQEFLATLNTFTPNFGRCIWEGIIGSFFNNANSYVWTFWVFTYECVGAILTLLGIVVLRGNKIRFAFYFVMLTFSTSYYNYFVLGMLLCDLYCNLEKLNDILMKYRMATLLLLLASCYGVIASGFSETSKMTRIVFGISCIMCLLSILNLRDGEKVFGNSFMYGWGKLSFAIYLVHLPVMESFSSYYLIKLTDLGIGYRCIVATDFVLTALIILAAAYLFKKYIVDPGKVLIRYLTNILEKEGYFHRKTLKHRELYESKIEMSTPLFSILLIYIIAVWLCECADLFSYALGADQKTELSRIVVVCVLLGGYYYFKNAFFYRKNHFEWTIAMGIILIAILGFIKGVIPDLGFDTINYHLVSQNPGFINYFKDHFGLGNFQVWGFRLADRLFYPFRETFGFRMGTQLNTIVLIVVYVQLVIILRKIYMHLGGREKLSGMPEIYALLITLSQKNLMDLGSYYVDIMAMPVCLEIFFLIMKAKKEETSSAEIVYFALLNGICFAMKMTNIVYIVPAIIIYICFVKHVSLKEWILSAVGCAAPCSVYLIVNYIFTKNPVFPYFNSLFQSPYFKLSNFKDGRWGPKTVFEKIFWLFYTVFKPEYRQSELPNTCTILFQVGIIALIVIIVAALYKRINKDKEKKAEAYLWMVIFVLVSSTLWALSTGYERYYMFGMMVLAILGYVGFLLLLSFRGTVIMMGSFVGLSVFVASCQCFEVINGQEWGWRNCNLSGENTRFVKDLEYIFRDQEYEGTFDVEQIDAFFITSSLASGIANWMNPKAFVYNYSYMGYLDSEVAKTEFNRFFDCQANARVYDIVGRGAYDEKTYIKMLEKCSLGITEFHEVSTNIGDYYLIGIQKIS